MFSGRRRYFLMTSARDGLATSKRSTASSPMTRSVFTKEYDLFRGLMIEARKASGLTQQQVAKKLRCSQSFVSKYERGERRLDVVEFLEVARVIGCDPLSILERLGRV